MTDITLPITGYLDRFSYRPGDLITAYVSKRTPGRFRTRLVRVVSGDPNPAGPGLQLPDLSNRLDTQHEGTNQAISLGSHALVPATPRRVPGLAMTWTALIWVRTPTAAATVIAEQNEDAAITLTVGPNGAGATVTTDADRVTLHTGDPILTHTWYRVWVSADPAGERIIVGQQSLDGGAPLVQSIRARPRPPNSGSLLIAACDVQQPTGHFTGKIQDPTILAGAYEIWADPFEPDALSASNVIASWDFSREMASQSIIDIGPHGCHGRLVNLPTRAMVAAGWQGEEMCWRHAPRDYAAIHFHADDLGDCGWQPSFTWMVPDDLRSGAYALWVSAEDGEDWLPFYVLPKRRGPHAPIAFLASTFTYQAYANHARDSTDEAFRARVADWGAYPHNPDQYPIYGRSTYNVHVDGSGISFSSRRRPILTMRPAYITFNDPHGSGLRHYPADTHLLGWMEAKGLQFDIITDEDLDDEGVELLRPYRVVITGSHPEYHTPGTLDALMQYTRSGGRMAYVGGNGFYWRIARHKSMPWVTELRRAEGGIRTWAAEPGEYYHQLDGQYGGLWRRNRRAPQVLAGVGFSGQGLFEGTYYRLMPAARDPRFAWMFAGINEEIIGDYGLSGGGAAGFELDRADVALGTPHDAVILGRSEDPPGSFFTVPEEVLSGRRTITGESLESLLRAEIVYFEPAGGGAVFSVGSITFCGSLWREGWDGPVSRLLENVMRRFSSA